MFDLKMYTLTEGKSVGSCKGWEKLLPIRESSHLIQILKLTHVC